jgi:putative SOS response-associated peptidase YedK
MCGRYSLHSQPEVIALQFAIGLPLPALKARYNMAPSQQAPVVRCRADGTREIVLMRWGLVPHWSKEPKTTYSTINAMAETVDTKPAYRTAFRRRRVLAPANGYFEWKALAGGKQPWYFRPKGAALLAFAGFWERWGEGEQAFDSYSIIVTDANDVARPIQSRMPVILSPETYAFWLDPAVTDPAALKPLLIPCPSDWIEAYPVSTRVNSPKNDEPNLVEPA